MIIPHGERNIFSIQLSNFTIFFGIIVMVSVVSASLLSNELNKGIQPEFSELSNRNQATDYKREQYLENLQALSEYHETLKDQLVVLFEKAALAHPDTPLISPDSQFEDMAKTQVHFEGLRYSNSMDEQLVAWEKNPESVTPENAKLLKEYKELSETSSFSFNDDVIVYRKLHLDVKKTVDILTALESFLEEREDAHKNLPYYWPMAGGRFTSFFGPRISPFSSAYNEFHTGVDLAEGIGTPIYSSASGRVIATGYVEGYGNRVTVQHRFGYSTVYAHMSTIAVGFGQEVKRGDMLGRVGMTGRTTGPHLHYEVRISGRAIDPLQYLTSK